jgi:arsenate reductase (thioredoxin)
MIFPDLKLYIDTALNGITAIPAPRRDLLDSIARYLQVALADKGEASLTFICTHNSRRSHFGQIWAAVAAAHYGITGLHTYSGGTETTAFNPRAIAALKRAGFRISSAGGVNPLYAVAFSDTDTPLRCFSKLYDHPSNPARHFGAVMTCSEAEENCPFIPGADKRFPLTYEDPKAGDDRPEESALYDERCLQIATEMLYCLGTLR